MIHGAKRLIHSNLGRLALLAALTAILTTAAFGWYGPYVVDCNGTNAFCFCPDDYPCFGPRYDCGTLTCDWLGYCWLTKYDCSTNCE